MKGIPMTIHIGGCIDRALQNAFAKALERVVETKAEAFFEKAFANGSPFSQKLEEKITEGFQRFFEKRIRWEKKKPGFKNQ
jgi:hypothetical protein